MTDIITNMKERMRLSATKTDVFVRTQSVALRCEAHAAYFDETFIKSFEEK